MIFYDSGMYRKIPYILALGGLWVLCPALHSPLKLSDFLSQDFLSYALRAVGAQGRQDYNMLIFMDICNQGCRSCPKLFSILRTSLWTGDRGGKYAENKSPQWSLVLQIQAPLWSSIAV